MKKNAALMPAFTTGQRVRYKPGTGTYGLEDCLDADGRIPGVVVGITAQRVRVELDLEKRRDGSTSIRTVDPASLQLVADGTA